MKIDTKFAKLSLTMGALMLGVLMIGSRTQADQNQGIIQEKALSKPYVVYGAGAVQKTQVAQTLGINDNYQKLVTQVSDAKYLGLTQLKNPIWWLRSQLPQLKIILVTWLILKI
ncbi:Uncharacterised protein [Weissella viridescens]|uniref:Uncharacterized protein n=1 Tax=Weissella viridescens TaxID=1629 RepID=A0A380P6X7_WEIVI|nr:Uncharacterised protein [Weissella viridescens]